MLGRIGFVNRDVQLGAAADEALATLQAGGVHGVGFRPSVAKSSSVPSWRST